MPAKTAVQDITQERLRQLAGQWRHHTRQLDIAQAAVINTQADIDNPPHKTSAAILDIWRGNLTRSQQAVEDNQRQLDAIESELDRHSVDRNEFEKLAARTPRLVRI